MRNKLVDYLDNAIKSDNIPIMAVALERLVAHPHSIAPSAEGKFVVGVTRQLAKDVIRGKVGLLVDRYIANRDRSYKSSSSTVIFRLDSSPEGYIPGEYLLWRNGYTLPREELQEVGLEVMKEFGADFEDPEAKEQEETAKKVLNWRDESADDSAVGHWPIYYRGQGFTFEKRLTYRERTGELVMVSWIAHKRIIHPLSLVVE